MESDTIKLLKECNAGCKTATNSMEQVKDKIENECLSHLIDYNNKKHIEIGDRCHELLNKLDKDEKDPPASAKMFTFMSTEIKLMMNSDTSTIAKIMFKGCNMGVEKLSEYLNDYKDASPESKSLVKELIATEETFAEKLKEFL
ncbi:MAG: hypothetical protein EOM30_05025 [Clostridia bacterium]|nr:hypothetical protein [Clostridia bacterium]NLS85275.1 hypothetical protein [Oscillospiraceae bacterium]